MVESSVEPYRRKRPPYKITMGMSEWAASVAALIYLCKG